MTKESILLSKSSSVLTALKKISKNGLGFAVVVDKKNKFLGVLNDFDIRKGLVEGMNISDNISTIYNKNPITLTNPISDNQIMQIMQSKAYRKVQPSFYPVINQKRKFIKIIKQDELRFSNFKINKKNSSKNSKQKKVLLIGGAGYIGSVLSNSLIKNKFKVAIFDKFIYGNKHLKKRNYELIKGDTNNIEQLFNVIKDVDYVIHLAELVGDPLCAIRPENTYKTNFLSTITISNICKNLKIEKFIYFSSCSVYGSNINEKPLDETSILNPLSIYAKIKLMCEKAIMQSADDYFKPIIVRLGTVFGYSPRMRLDLVINSLVYKAIKFKKIMVNGGNQWRPFIHLDDISKIILKILKNQRKIKGKNIYNIVGENRRILDVAKDIKKILPSTKIIVDNKNTDKRNYKVSGRKVKKDFSFFPAVQVKKGIKSLVKNFKKNPIKNFKSKKYHNVLNSEKF